MRAAGLFPLRTWLENEICGCTVFVFVAITQNDEKRTKYAQQNHIKTAIRSFVRSSVLLSSLVFFTLIPSTPDCVMFRLARNLDSGTCEIYVEASIGSDIDETRKLVNKSQNIPTDEIFLDEWLVSWPSMWSSDQILIHFVAKDFLGRIEVILDKPQVLSGGFGISTHQNGSTGSSKQNHP